MKQEKDYKKMYEQAVNEGEAICNDLNKTLLQLDAVDYELSKLQYKHKKLKAKHFLHKTKYQKLKNRFILASMELKNIDAEPIK